VAPISDVHADVSTSVTSRGHSSNEQVTLARISLLEVIVAMSSFYPSLLRYYCSDIVAAMSRMSVAIVAYDMLLQWCVIVVVSNA
jgi:hypothetical protein